MGLHDELADLDALHQDIEGPSPSSVTKNTDSVKLTENTIKSILLVLYSYSLPSHDYLLEYSDTITKILKKNEYKSSTEFLEYLITEPGNYPPIPKHLFATLIEQSNIIVNNAHRELGFDETTGNVSTQLLHHLFRNTSNTHILQALRVLAKVENKLHITSSTQDHSITDFPTYNHNIDDLLIENIQTNQIDIGEQIGAQNWILKECIGIGGMGSVWKVENHFGETGALKVMNHNIGQSDQFIARFHLEIRSLKKLDHPNIVKLLDWGCDTSHGHALWFFVTEFIHGQSLSQLIKSEEKLDHDTIYQIFLELSHGLKVAHNQGIIHRDIKPSNIMLSDDKKPTLIDFGIARRSKDPSITQTNERLLTLRFASPEQMYGDPVSHASDIFSLAATISECLIGKPQKTRPKFTPELIPTRFHKVLEVALHYEAEKRPQNMEAFIDLWEDSQKILTTDQYKITQRDLVKSSSQTSENLQSQVSIDNNHTQTNNHNPQTNSNTNSNTSSTNSSNLYTQTSSSVSTKPITHELEAGVDLWFRKAKSNFIIQFIAVMSFTIAILTGALRLQMTPLFNSDQFQISAFTKIPHLLEFYAGACLFLTLPLYKVKIWSLCLAFLSSLALWPLYNEFYKAMYKNFSIVLADFFDYVLISYSILLFIGFFFFLRVQRARRKLSKHGINLNY
jgi:serine/threonine protein kinase